MAFIINVGDSSLCSSAFGMGHALVNRIETMRLGYMVIKFPVDPRIVGR